MKRVGVFGMGFWAPLAEAVHQWLPEVRVDRVWSQSEPKARDMAGRLGCRVAEDRHDVAGLDLAVVALPPAAIPDVARACVGAGVTSLLEKPVSLDPAVVRELDAQFRAAGVRAAVNLQGRFVPAFHATRDAIARREYGTLREVDIHALGNRGCLASPLPWSWHNRVESGGGVRGISGPHAAEFLLALAGSAQVVYERGWIEVPEREDADGLPRPCTALDNVEILTAHPEGVHGRLRLGTTARKKEEVWTVRSDEGSIRIDSDGRPVLVENFGEVTELPSSREAVLESVGLSDHEGLQQCPIRAFPSLTLLTLLLGGGSPDVAPLPDLALMADCLDVLAGDAATS